jgi:hypothetical protein
MLNAAWLTLITYSLALSFLALAPAALLVYLIPGGWQRDLSSRCLAAAEGRADQPFAIARMMQVFPTIGGARSGLTSDFPMRHGSSENPGQGRARWARTTAALRLCGSSATN